jgi:hypothetical protein
MHASCAPSTCPIFGCGEDLSAGNKPGLEYRPMRGRRKSPRFEKPGLGFYELLARCALIGGALLILIGALGNMSTKAHRRRVNVQDQRPYYNPLPLRLGFGASALGLMIYASLNGIQALVLSRARRASRRQDYEGLVAIYGKAEVDGALLETSFGEPCLYFYELEERFHRIGHKSSPQWHFEAEREHCRPLKVNGVRVENRPSELYGMKTHVEYMSKTHRRTTSYLPVGRPLTVMGWVQTRQGEAYLSKHGEVGMIFSAYSPRRTMIHELTKAALFLALTMLALALLVIS